MKWLLFIAVIFGATQALAQALPTDPKEVQALLEASGCKFEVGTAAQTIANLQKQINDLKKQLEAKKK